MVYSLSGLDQLDEENVAQAMAALEETGLSRILVTDSAGKVLYDTRETNDAVGEYSFYTEIVQALLGVDTSSSSYRDGAFRSRAASPVLYQNQIIGAVYAYEYDTEQAALLEGAAEQSAAAVRRHRRGHALYQRTAVSGADQEDRPSAHRHPEGAGGVPTAIGRR